MKIIQFHTNWKCDNNLVVNIAFIKNTSVEE